MTPVAFAGCHGVLHPATGRRGVIICGSLGYEALNICRAQVFLAERLAEAGFPTLRIDYYSTGDSAGGDDTPERFQAWIDSIVAAVRWLRANCDVGPAVLCGLRIGAALAARAALEIDDIDALLMLAPVTTGRRFLRELILAARSMAEVWQSRNVIDDGYWFEAHGLRLDRLTREAFDSLDIGKLDLPLATRILMLERRGAPSSHDLVNRLRAQGVDVTHETCDGFDRLLRDSHENEVPHMAFARAVGWLGDADRIALTRADPAFQDTQIATIDLGTAREIPVRFGNDKALAGILTLPARESPNAPVVLIASTGANPRWGHSRGTVTLARWLAEHGLASLRMDGAGIGDAALATGERGQPYSKQGDWDVMAGVDYLATRLPGPIVVFGMCSGAYHAFQAALLDHRIIGLMLVNLQKFVWHESESLSVVQRTTFRTTRFYMRNMISLSVWARLLRGRINVIGIARALAGRAARHVAAAVDPAIAAVRGETQVGMVHRQLRELAARSVQILYILSGNDPGLDEIAEYFGMRGWRLRHNSHIMFQTIDGADHTLSAQWARDALRRNVAIYLRRRFGVAIGYGVDVAETRPVPFWKHNFRAPALPLVPPLAARPTKDFQRVSTTTGLWPPTESSGSKKSDSIPGAAFRPGWRID
jgi:dienelactone hydrolase